MSTSGDSPRSASGVALQPWVRLLVWPITAVFVLAMFRDPLSDLIRRATKFEVKKDGVVIVAAEIAANLGAAEATRFDRKTDAKTQVNLEGVAATAASASGSLSINQAKVLWVDDNPDNNQYERNALLALGVQFELAITTEDALRLLKTKNFNLVITDFARYDDPQGGYTLLDQVRTLSSPPPLIIYSSSANPQHEKDARSRGAYGETNRPQELFDLAVRAILSK
jgi:CheY-like chemotaxis protein